MTQRAKPKSLGLFDSRVPRYTSYPTAPVFGAAVGAAFQTACLKRLAPDVPISVYVHIPYCERSCWFCACRTQGTRTLGVVETGVQNDAATGAYAAPIALGSLAGYRDHVLSAHHHLRARVIEMLRRDFRLDLFRLCAPLNASPAELTPIVLHIAAQFGDLVCADQTGLTILPACKPLARIIAQRFDAYPVAETRFSKAS